MENPPNKPQYIVAVEETPTTLRKICNQLSRELGSGMCKNVPVEEAFFYPTIKVVPIFKCLCRQLTIQSANISIFPKILVFSYCIDGCLALLKIFKYVTIFVSKPIWNVVH